MNTKNLKTVSGIVSSAALAGALLGTIATGTAQAQTRQTKVTAKPAVKQTGLRTKRINPNTKRVSMELQNASVRRALTQLFQQTGADYSIDSRIAGNVTLKVRNQPFQTALRTLIDNASQPLTYAVENGTYFIKPAGRVTSVAASNRVAQNAPIEGSVAVNTVPAEPNFGTYAEQIGPNVAYAPTAVPQQIGNNVILSSSYGPYSGFNGFNSYAGYGGYGGNGYFGGNTVVQAGAFAPGGVYGYNYGGVPFSPYGQGFSVSGPGFFNPATGVGAYYGFPGGTNFYSTRGVYFGF